MRFGRTGRHRDSLSVATKPKGRNPPDPEIGDTTGQAVDRRCPQVAYPLEFSVRLNDAVVSADENAVFGRGNVSVRED